MLPATKNPPTSHLRRVIAEDLTTLDQARAEAELIDLVAGLQQTRLVRALLLECKILAPYKVALRARFDVKIFDYNAPRYNPNII